VKLHDLGPNYDFVSARAGIQQFNADFRGFLFVDEQPAVRIFGNFHSGRIEYNLAYFQFLEKNTNSGLNTFERPPAGAPRQRLFTGFFSRYTAEFVAAGIKMIPACIMTTTASGRPSRSARNHQNPGRPDSSRHSRRLLRLARQRAHSPYQCDARVLSSSREDTFNPIAASASRSTRQMAAAEISYDKDWIRYRVSAFYTSGDSNPRDSRARGFDSIVDLPNFAGGLFSFWNREGIRFLGSGVL